MIAADHAKTASSATDACRLGMIEAGRALAALAVVLFHTDTIVTTNIVGAKALPLLGLGERGVDFFFVLSGFIITLVHADDIGRPDRLKYFAWRRWSRLYPILWLVVAGTTAMNVIVDGELYGAAKLWTSLRYGPAPSGRRLPSRGRCGTR